jgi:Ni,Fe-hydrogenase III large subunit
MNTQIKLKIAYLRLDREHCRNVADEAYRICGRCAWLAKQTHHPAIAQGAKDMMQFAADLHHGAVMERDRITNILLDLGWTHDF